MLKVKTIKLKDMVSKAIKGASNNKILPLTGMLAIELKDNTLTLTTTDFSNYLEIKCPKIEGEDFYVVVQAEMFHKLISKLSTEYVTLELKDNVLAVKSNGQYKLELPVDENGKLVKFPEYRTKIDTPAHTINLTTLKTLLTTNKASVAQDLTVPALTGYYICAEGVWTSDSFTACKNKITSIKETFMLPAQVVELFNVLTDSEVNIYVGDTNVILDTPDVVIYGKLLLEKDNFPIEAVTNYLDTKFDSNCKFNKDDLLSILDRLLLFVGPYDKNEVYLTFTNEGMVIESKQQTGKELIPYSESANFVAFTCCIDIELLKSQVQAQQGELIELFYGNDSAIKLVSGPVTQIVSLSEDNRGAAV